MYGNNYFMPYGMNYGMPLGMGLRRSSMVPKTGLLGRLGGVTGAVKGINWGGLLNNASRTRNLNTFEKINLSKPLKNGYFFVKF